MTKVRAGMLTTLLILGSQCYAQFRDVNVRNSPASPVPVQQQGSVDVAGSVSISGTPNVNVSNIPSVNVSNSPSVTVSNTPNVNVTNAATAPVPVRNNDDPARNLVQPNVGCVALTGALSCTTGYVVPSGQTLVLDYINFVGDTGGTGSSINYYRISVVGGGVSRQFFFAPGSASGSGTLFVKSEPVQIFADAGSTVTFDGLKTSTTGLVGINFTFSGHLIAP